MNLKKDEEIERLKKMSLFEKKLSYNNIAGIDEVGRGPLAGPVVAVACILYKDFFLKGINDSKKIAKNKRRLIYKKLIEDEKINYGIGIVDAKIIDEINILKATFLAMTKALKNLKKRANYLLIDGNKFPFFSIPSIGIINGDSLSISIAAASIIAKETRDGIMAKYDEKYPLYGFLSNSGYGTKKHIEAIYKHGVLDIHRKSFEPIKSLIN